MECSLWSGHCGAAYYLFRLLFGIPIAYLMMRFAYKIMIRGRENETN